MQNDASVRNLRTQRHLGHLFLFIFFTLMLLKKKEKRGGVCNFRYGEPLLFLNTACNEERNVSHPLGAEPRAAS